MRVNHLSRGRVRAFWFRRIFGPAALFDACLGMGGLAVAADVVSGWTITDIRSPQVVRPSSPNILGTVALPITAKPTGTRWSKLMMASLDQPVLARLIESAQSLSPQDQVDFVQSAVNHAVRTPPSSFNCSDDGYWPPASETLARGTGDCFDIAIAKMEALRSLGFPSRDLYLTTGRFGPGHETGAGRESVALLVRVGEHFWLLTEREEHAIQANRPEDITTEFTPILTYGVGSTWVHGRLMNIAALGR